MTELNKEYSEIINEKKENKRKSDNIFEWQICIANRSF